MDCEECGPVLLLSNDKSVEKAFRVSSILQKNLYKTCGMQIIFASVFACFAQINLLYSFFFAKIFVPLCPQLDKYGNKVSV